MNCKTLHHLVLPITILQPASLTHTTHVHTHHTRTHTRTHTTHTVHIAHTHIHLHTPHTYVHAPTYTYSHTVTCPEVVIKQDGESAVSVATQTSDHSDLVQITVPLDQLLMRVDAFTQLKRRQIDASNQIEFCCRSDPDTSCARTDAVYMRRSSHQRSHIPSTRVRVTG